MNTLLVLGQTIAIPFTRMKQAYSGIQKNILFFELAKTKQTEFYFEMSFISVCACFKLALMSKLVLHASLHFFVLPFVFSYACADLTRVKQAV
jgi:hypothetical protein